MMFSRWSLRPARAAVSASLAVLLLGGCAQGSLESTVSAELQQEVRAIAAQAADGAFEDAIAAADQLRTAVDAAEQDGSISADRASLINARIDALILALEEDAVPAETAPPATEAPPVQPVPTTEVEDPETVNPEEKPDKKGKKDETSKDARGTRGRDD